MAYSVTTITPINLPRVEPIYRFTDDATVYMANRVSTPSTPPPTFNIDVRALHATILARTGDVTGVIAYGTDTEDLYVYDGTNWQIYENS